MKTIEIGSSGGLENLRCVERDVPQPGPGEILVRWHATSLNYHDYIVALGGIAVPEGRIPMSDGAGEVSAVGEGVSQWQPGDKVMSAFFPAWIAGEPTPANTADISGETVDGFACEYSVVSADVVTRIPRDYSYAEAACLPCAGLTAWNGLMENSAIEAGDSVLVQGTGGVSLLALQIARACGATVYATTSSAEKAEKLRQLGAEHIVNYKEVQDWGKHIHKLSDGGVHRVVDVGGPSTLHHSIAAARMSAKIACIGILGGVKTELTLPTVFFKHLQIIGVAVGSQEMQQRMVDFIDTHGFKPEIDRIFELEEIASAFEYQSSGKQFGKIVLSY